MDIDLLHKIVIYQKSYFEIIYDFFIKFVGKKPNEFNDFEEVGLYLKETYYNNKNNMAFLSYKEKVREELEENLTKLYPSHLLRKNEEHTVLNLNSRSFRLVKHRTFQLLQSLCNMD